ncbi:FAD-dependent monooxygenase [Actinoplanes sp. KI2]|uniref:FAD-dependent monooxygenase n=1 Tax=Actinoplanes sp. KI2 TaxID=2983315 RepID=UPI0021D5A4B0|nr:FAD-dependent monooxygenase [Actinoplanes sp. KI2]MCU7725217.1 FAD-dependent monooxygenase [Actinoplanes sp. KI2]
MTAAYWLDRFGFEVTVVERSAGLRPGGQALDIRGPALEVARRMGVLDEFRKRTTELRGMSMVDDSGAEIYRTTERTLTGGRLDSEDLEVLRDDLIDVLHGACGAGVRFIFGNRITSLNQDDHGIDVEFENAAPGRFGVVIGADGAHSGTRRLVFGPEKPFLRYMGGRRLRPGRRTRRGHRPLRGRGPRVRSAQSGGRARTQRPRPWRRRPIRTRRLHGLRDVGRGPVIEGLPG